MKKVLLPTLLLCVEISKCFVRLVPVVDVASVRNNEKFINTTSIIHHDGIKNTNQTIDWEIELSREIKDLRVTVSYYIVTINGATQNALITRSVDACAFLKRPAMDRFVKHFWEHMKRDSRLPARCPVKHGYYYIRGVRPSEVPIPGFFPENDFLLEMQFILVSRNEPLAESRMYGKLVRIIDEIRF